MHRAGLSDKGCPKGAHHPIGLQQGAPKALHIYRIVLSMNSILVKWHCILDLARHGPDVDVDIEALQSKHELGIEVLNRHWRQCDALDAAVAGFDQKPMFDEIKNDIERSCGIRDGRRAEPARGDIQSDIPPMIQ